MNSIENAIYKKGYNYIACIDEVGRGCLLGDVLACAIIMPKGLILEGVKDSKKLTEKRRTFLYNLIIENAIGLGIGRVNSTIIDEINIKEASRLAMKLAVGNILDKDSNKLVPDFLLIDAESIDMDIPQKSIIKGDSISHGIASASIVAKVTRDSLCLDWEKNYPGYNISKHKGYGTKDHIERIKTQGVLPIHRLTFLKKILAR